MKVETPKKPSLPSVDALSRQGSYTLPPLSSLLTQPERPKLPSINSLTPSTPRFILPPRSISETSVITSVPVYQTQTSNNKHFLTPLDTSATTPVPTQSSAANTSVDYDADSSMNSSINDSMVKPATKRKASSTVSPTKDFAFISHSPATYPSQEPSIDNASLARRKRRRTSPHELAILNSEFEVGSTPNKMRRTDISRRVNMTEKAVKIWFQNKRQSLRRLKVTDKEITELPPTPDSSALASAPATESAPTPIIESTPIKPALTKSQSQEFVHKVIDQSSPIRSYSTSSLVQKTKKGKGTKTPLLSRMLAAEDEKPKENGNLVLNLTNKKQPEFARSAPAASTQVMTFKLAPSFNSASNSPTFVASKPAGRKPLGQIDTNIQAPAAKPAHDSSCVHSLLSLKSGNY